MTLDNMARRHKTSGRFAQRGRPELSLSTRRMRHRYAPHYYSETPISERMGNRPSTGVRPESASPLRTERLRRAFEQLEAVLESVDLRDESALADAVVDALNATDTAIEADSVDEDTRPDDRFVFPIRACERHAPRDRN